MLESISREVIVDNLLRDRDAARRAGQPGDPRVEILTALVLDLLMEVEALRRVVAESDCGTEGARAAYARAYRETAYLTHNSSGFMSGMEKLLAYFYPPASPERELWRECLMLQRLGFSAAQIQQYKAAAQEAETFT